jgi:hypothetical protein
MLTWATSLVERLQCVEMDLVLTVGILGSIEHDLRKLKAGLLHSNPRNKQLRQDMRLATKAHGMK